MTSPRHLWSGDWRRDSDAAAAELARRRAQAPGSAEPESSETAPPPPDPPPPPDRPVREPARTAATPRPVRAPAIPSGPAQPPRERAAPILRGAVERVRALIPTTQRQRRALVLIAVGAVALVGAAYGLAALGGSGGSPAPVIGSGQPWLGMELSQPPGGGVIVGSVAPGGPGDRAGIQAGDVILAAGNQSVNSPADVESVIDNMHVGDHVPLTVLRGAMSYTTLVKLAGRPAGTP